MTLAAIQSQFDIFPMVALLLLLHKLGGSEGLGALCPEVLLTFENNTYVHQPAGLLRYTQSIRKTKEAHNSAHTPTLQEISPCAG